MSLLKLPTHLQTDPVFTTIANYLTHSKIFYSSLFHVSSTQLRLIYKSYGCPYFYRDWRVYSLLRAYANLLCTTGYTIRTYPHMFTSTNCYNDIYVQSLYNHLRTDKQYVSILSKKMTTHHAQTLINPNCYNYIIPKNDTLHENIEMFIENGYSPILIEFGLKAMNSYFEEVFNGAKNRIDTLVLSKFYGQLYPKYQGGYFNPKLLYLYNRVWQSDKQPIYTSTTSKANLNEYLIFYVYQQKTILS